ncbi:MAG: hypothetical protein JSR46_02190 [Verrucomicrobia bacterium]|nr:hypothetical protein [Verrucomicrobiota bacterium]
MLDTPSEWQETPGAMRDLKEDKLNPAIIRQLVDINVLEGTEKGLSPQLAKQLQTSFKTLEATTASGCHCGLQELKQHLQVMQAVPGMADEQKTKVAALLHTIEASNAASLSRSETYNFPLLPRSEEVVLPSLEEMLADKTKFAS